MNESLIFPLMFCGLWCVKDGLLLGNVTNVITNTISDTDLSVVKHQIVYSKLMFCYGGVMHICKSLWFSIFEQERCNCSLM